MSGTYDRDKRKGQINPAVSYNFGLQVEAMFFVPLRAVRVFTKENEFDYYQEGGLNDYVHMLRKPISKPFTFQVEKYVGTDAGMFDQNSGFVDPLALGTDLILPVVLFVNRAQTKNAGENFSFNNCARAYIFTGCTVISKEYGELNSEQSKLLVETTTIAYKELFPINQFNPSAERHDIWDPKKDDSTHQSRRQNNRKKDAGETAGKNNLWIWDGTVAGKGKAHDLNRSKNRSKADGEAEAKKRIWDIKPPDPGKQEHPTGVVFPYMGNGQFNADERGRKNRHTAEGETEGNANQWIWDGTVAGKGKSHPQNRSKNTKPTPSIWPPNRRARKAEALAAKS